MMFPTTPISSRAFDLLTDTTSYNRSARMQRGQFGPLIVPSPQQRADGLWRENIFLAADAVIAVAIDLLCEAGAKRATVTHALADLQLAIINRLNDIDDGKQIGLVFAHDGRRYIAFTSESPIDALATVRHHFGNVDPDARIAVFSAPLHVAAAVVRQRAAAHDIDLPEKFWLTPEQLDAGADLLAAAISPRTSPIIQKWQAMRERETQTVVVS
jgi:hypothetical protein